MSFVPRIVGSVGQALGLVPKTPKVPDAPVAPSLTDPTIAGQADTNAQLAAASVQRGRTSTLLGSGKGFDEDPKNTSRILLGQ
jgi:hypothetical protein